MKPMPKFHLGGLRNISRVREKARYGSGGERHYFLAVTETEGRVRPIFCVARSVAQKLAEEDNSPAFHARLVRGEVR